MAERLASQLGQRVLVIDRRDHVAGNAYDYHDEHGVLVHRYGPHIFHTNHMPVVDYLSRFTEWRPYEHRVLARVARATCSSRCRSTARRSTSSTASTLETDEEVEAFYAERREPVELMKTSEDAVVAKVGRELYELFFRGYTRKQWQRDPSELHASVCARIPIRTNTDDRYFTDTFQQMPARGLHARCSSACSTTRASRSGTGTEFDDVRDEVAYDHLVYTGPIDELLRLPLRQAAVPLARVRAAATSRRPAARCSSPSPRSTSRASTCPTRGRPSTGT